MHPTAPLPLDQDDSEYGSSKDDRSSPEAHEEEPSRKEAQGAKRRKVSAGVSQSKSNMKSLEGSDSTATTSGSPPPVQRVETKKDILKTTTLPAHLLPASHGAGAKGRKPKEPGLIYFSRIPPGMGPSKVKHLLSNYGEVGRVFLARADKDRLPLKTSSDGKKKFKTKEKHQEHRFKEGWVEFTDKRVARSVADALNAKTIGGKKGSRWRDDVWTMVYLPRFRWDMLSEQFALERATQTSLLRFHIQHSKMEQENYLSAVEKARVTGKIEEKAEGRRLGKKAKLDESGETHIQPDSKKLRKPERERSYRQREPIHHTDSVGMDQRGLDGVLDRLF